MSSLTDKLRKGAHILGSRLSTQGLRTTLIWAYARGWARISGIPIEKYSRVTPQIYVGAQHGPPGMPKLAEWGIRGTINLRREYDDAQYGLVQGEYCYIPTQDDNAPGLDELARGVSFMERIMQSGGSVYIHCAGGVGRAPTMAAAYFIRQGMDLEHALAAIRSVRPFIKLTAIQIERLTEWQRRSRAVNS